MKMFSGMGLDGGDGSQDDGFMPMMQNMMKTLLSKEVLYPSLKEISEKVSLYIFFCIYSTKRYNENVYSLLFD